MRKWGQKKRTKVNLLVLSINNIIRMRKILNYSHVLLDIWHLSYIHEKIEKAVLPNGFQNSSISIKKLLHQRSHNWSYFSHRYRAEALLIYLKVDCLQYKIKWFKQMYVVDAPLRSEKKPWGTILNRKLLH